MSKTREQQRRQRNKHLQVIETKEFDEFFIKDEDGYICRFI